MEIRSVNKQGTSKVSATLSIRYNILEEGGSTIEVNGTIERDGDHVGSLSIYPDGKTVFYCEAGLSWSEKKSVFNTALNDAEKVFNPQES